MNVPTVKRFCDIIAKMGYNTLMLYTQDTYEVDNQPYFGYLRGRYSKEEIKEIDAYCISKGIELIPCIQTLAHLNCIFKWWDAYEDIRDCDDILLIGEEKTDKLIDDMFSTISQCFTSKRIHIGMDEAYRVGIGKYLAKHGYQERFDIINGHLHKVCENTRKAYLSGDKKKLLEIAEKDYTTAMERIKNFHKVYQKWWMSENKPHGFDMQDIRIGGALQRLESCKERIISYCKGELDSIPELEEQRLEGNTHTTWARTITPNVISHVV